MTVLIKNKNGGIHNGISYSSNRQQNRSRKNRDFGNNVSEFESVILPTGPVTMRKVLTSRTHSIPHVYEEIKVPAKKTCGENLMSCNCNAIDTSTLVTIQHLLCVAKVLDIALNKNENIY